MKTSITNKRLLVVLLALVMVFCIVLAACENNVKITFIVQKDTLEVGGQTGVSAIASNGENCTLSVDKADLVTIEDGILKVTGTVTEDTTVTITATLPSDSSVTETKVITIKAPAAGATISMTSDVTTIDRNTPATLTITTSDDSAYTVAVSDKELVYYNYNTHMLVVYGSVTEATEVTVTATLVGNSAVTVSKTFTVVPVKAAPKITISAVDRIKFGDDPAYITVTVTGGAEYTLEYNNESIVTIGSDNKIKVIKEPAYDTTVTITAKVKGYDDVKATKKVLVKAPRKDNVITGSNGLSLTNAMIQVVGNSSITVTGTIKDVYNDYNAPAKSYVDEYDTTVKMSDDKWIGSWNIKGKNNVSTDAYQKGTESHEIKTSDNEVVEQHVMERVYINKNNVVSYTTIKDYQSIPVMWEEQHLWNHLGSLTTDSFEFDSDNEVFRYIDDASNADVAYFMEYLKYSFTPILTTEDGALGEMYLVVEDGAIVGLKARTLITYYGSETAENASGESYTEIDLRFSDIGSTSVPDPVAYTAPQNADKLQAAIDNMKDATNYTFNAVDTTTYAPVSDPSDYEMSSVSSDVQLMSVSKNHTSAKGTVGLIGYITADSILLEKTSEYSSTMDGKPYRLEYTGYMKNADNTYDYFEYSADKSEFEGKRKITGSITDVLPTWDFSANIFQFVTSKKVGNSTTYEFTVRDTAVTAELAQEVSMHNNASDGEASADNRFTIIVDDNGNVISTTYPYAFASGTYRGYITTTYSKVGSTTIDEKEFTGYVPRTISANWADYDLRYYHPGHNTQNVGNATALEVLKVMFGDDANDFPPMTVFSKVFDDDISGPFYDWKESTGANGEKVYAEIISLTARTDDIDENWQITNETYNRIVKALEDELKEYGFKISVANTSEEHGLFDRTSRFVTFINEDKGMQITLENNHTRNFWIDFYNIGTWTLSK